MGRMGYDSGVSRVPRRLLHSLESDLRVSFAVLFGSRAENMARPDSDWDVAVFLDPSLDAGAAFEFRRGLLAALSPDLDVDLVVLNEAPPLLAAKALTGQRLLVRDPSAFVRFFVKTLSMVEDDRHFARIHARARRARLREGRFGRP